MHRKKTRGCEWQESTQAKCPNNSIASNVLKFFVNVLASWHSQWTVILKTKKEKRAEELYIKVRTASREV